MKDGFGEKLTLSDPDKGNWSYAYDGFGELTATTDALGHTLTTTYDKLGRKLTVSNPHDARLVTLYLRHRRKRHRQARRRDGPPLSQ